MCHNEQGGSTTAPQTDELRHLAQDLRSVAGTALTVNTDCPACSGGGFTPVRRRSMRMKRCSSCGGTGQLAAPRRGGAA